MVNDGDGLAFSGPDGPAATEEVDLVIGVAAAVEVDRQMEVEEAGVGSGTQDIAFVDRGLGPGVVGRETCGSADGEILTLQFMIEEALSWAVLDDFLEGEERDQALLEGAETAFDFSFCLRTGSDQVGDAESGEGALELRAWIPTVGGGLVTEEGQPIGVDRQWASVPNEGAAEVLEMMPGGVGGNEGTGEVFTGVVVDGEEEGLLGVARPPLVDGGIVLPEFANAGALPSAFGFGGRIPSADKEWEVSASVSCDGLTVALEGEALGEFVGDQLVVGWPLEGQEGGKEASHISGP